MVSTITSACIRIAVHKVCGMCVFIKFTCVLILLAPRRKYIFYETQKHRHISGDGFTTSFRYSFSHNWIWLEKMIVFYVIVGEKKRVHLKTFDDLKFFKTRVVVAIVAFLWINVKKMQFTRVQYPPYNEWTTTSVSTIRQWVVFIVERSFSVLFRTSRKSLL